MYQSTGPVTYESEDRQPSMSIYDFFSVFRYNPIHSFGLYTSQGSGQLTSVCNGIIPEYSWQSAEATGRNEIRNALLSAESILERYLGYPIAPRYISYRIPYPRFNTIGLWYSAYSDPNGGFRSLQLPHGYVQQIGVPVKEAIELNVEVAYSDWDNDDFLETATITFNTAITNPEEIAIYFLESDIPELESMSERWRIHPSTITFNAGVATVKIPAVTLVQPQLLEGLNAGDGLDGEDGTNFITHVDVYRRYCDPDGITIEDSQAVFYWEAIPPCCTYGCCDSCGACCPSPAEGELLSSDPHAVATAIGRAGIRNRKMGQVFPALSKYVEDTDTWITRCEWGSFCKPPDSVLVRAYVGSPFVNGFISKDLKIVIARLAAAELNRPLCACDTSVSGNSAMHEWQFDMTLLKGAADEAYAISFAEMENPIGKRRGHIQAWRYIQQMRRGQGIAI